MNKQAYLEEAYNSAFNDELEKVALSEAAKGGLYEAGTLTASMVGLNHVLKNSFVGKQSLGKSVKDIAKNKGALALLGLVSALGYLGGRSKDKANHG